MSVNHAVAIELIEATMRRRKDESAGTVDEDTTRARRRPLPSAAYLDRLILSVAHRQWQKVARIIGRVMDQCEQDRFAPKMELIGLRVQSLAERGLLESQGLLTRWRHSEVRLPAEAQRRKSPLMPIRRAAISGPVPVRGPRGAAAYIMRRVGLIK
jgi:hypothetical protein